MNVLLADDVEGWLYFHKRNLEQIFTGHELNLHAFFSAHEAYDFAFTFPENIDLVLTDLQMEAMDILAGEWLVNNLKTTKATQSAKIIIISSCYNIDTIAQRTNADGFLRKSSYQINPSMLKYKLEEFFGAI